MQKIAILNFIKYLLPLIDQTHRLTNSSTSEVIQNEDIYNSLE